MKSVKLKLAAHTNAQTQAAHTNAQNSKNGFVKSKAAGPNQGKKPSKASKDKQRQATKAAGHQAKSSSKNHTGAPKGKHGSKGPAETKRKAAAKTTRAPHKKKKEGRKPSKPAAKTTRAPTR